MAPNPIDDAEVDTSCITQDIFERDLILDELKRTLQFAATNIDQFRSRTIDLTVHQRKFTKIQTKIEKASIKSKTFNKEANIKIRNDFNDLYYAIVTHLNNLKEVDVEKRRASRASNPCDVPINDRRNLPKLSLPEYHGEATGWSSFFDLFQSLIHNNNAYTDAEKFRYLLLSVKNEPHNLIKSIPITESNYSIALEILKSRYDNKRIIASQHLDKLFDIEVCSARSAVSIRNLLNVYHENIKALEVLEFPVKEWDFVLLNLLLRKIPVTTRKEYERSLTKPNEIPQVQGLITFLERELSAEQMITVSNIQSIKNNYPSNKNINSSQNSPKRVFTTNMASAQSRPYDDTNNVRSCLKCKGSHGLHKCLEFLDLSTKDRFAFVQTNNICYNCLWPGHDLRNCKSNFKCRKCNKKHHTLIHFDANATRPVISHTAKTDAVSLAPMAPPDSNAIHCPSSVFGINENQNSCSLNKLSTRTNTVLLSTALVDLYYEGNKIATIRCMLDGGSQATLITESCMQRLNLPRRHVSEPLLGVGDLPLEPRGTFVCSISPKGKSNPIIPLEATILSKLTRQMPSVPLAPLAEWPHLQGLVLADPEFHKPQPVDMILGEDILMDIIREGIVRGKPGTPTAINSVFGYLLGGKVNFTSYIPTPRHACFTSFDNDNLQKFWELESVPEMRSYTPDEKLCESFFQKTHTRDESGRYVVALPFKPDAPPLGESRQIALARFHKLEYRLERNPQLKADYHSCLQEYVDLNHMELADDNPPTGASYYLPHHCVSKLSETTRTRVVYDAGCRTTSGHSLNDVLLTGPKLHLDIVDVLLKFRLHNIAFCCDIKQMYRNILIRESDRDFQRILWRQSPEEPLRDYRLRTVTFGISSSPYLALRTIKQLAHDEAKNFPLASPILLNDVFVDDVVTGAGTTAEALALQQELIGICATAGFELRKWQSNSPAILAATRPPESHGERHENVHFAEMENDKGVKVLGLQWNPGSDAFSFKVQSTSKTCTKRAILSEIAKIYDPLGLLSPVTLYAKHLIQLLWLAKVPWDSEPPVNIVNSWMSFINELPLLSQISFPRHIFNTNDFDSIEIHGFADASQIAYAACVYLRLTDNAGRVQTYLVMAKSRVAPLRVCLTIPKMELMGCVILSKLIERVMHIYGDRIRSDQVYAWSDSSVVLAWLQSPPHEWKTFVSNRTSEILSRVPASCWRHVSSADNSADPASRGLLPAALVQNDLWRHGPSWLQLSHCSWPIQNPIVNTTEEKRNNNDVANTSYACVSNLFVSQDDDSLITRFSSLGKLVRVTAFIFRFYNKCRKHKQSLPEYITVPEYHFALKRLIYVTQHKVFENDINNILANKLPSTRLRRLTPIIDSEGLLRVGGRIHKSFLPFESKHQLILPKKHILTNLIIDDTHKSELHAGPQCVQTSLLQRYWIISGRDVVRLRVHRCIPCFRARPIRTQPRMGMLPAVRLRPARVFSKTSCDFCGPFYVRANKVRNAKIIKCYVAVFVCMSVKAVHLELVSELSTEGFLAALRRFTSRRGHCSDIYTDCGRNFVGCNNYLKELYAFLRNDSVMSELNKQTLKQGLTWHFQPPYASHFGGLFEAAVKSFKTHLHRVIGTQTQTYDCMHTLTCQIEGILNSRPLCVLSSDSADPVPLTPAHFLIGEPLTALPDVSLVDENPSRLTRWRWVQQAVQHFWRRWSREYLHQLQQSSKWLQDRGTPIREGIVVVVCDDHLPPLQWKLARVHAVHPGTDHVIRVVTLKSGNTLTKRPVVKVCPLPIE